MRYDKKFGIKMPVNFISFALSIKPYQVHNTIKIFKINGNVILKDRRYGKKKR